MAGEGVVMKAHSFSTLILLALSITPAWGMSEIPTASPAIVPAPGTLAVPPNAVGKLPDTPSFDSLTMQIKALVPPELLASLPSETGESHWPISWKTVYPTGEKPLWVLTLKCPTEAAFGVAPPPVKVVHVILTTAMDAINATGVFPVNLQQVCQ
jgi:hypothetical protein